MLFHQIGHLFIGDGDVFENLPIGGMDDTLGAFPRLCCTLAPVTRLQN